MAPPRSLAELSRTTAIVVTVLCLVVATIALRTGSPGTRIDAIFNRAEGIYAGDEVRVLGVPVGKITDIETTKHGVRLKMSIKDSVQVPANAGAVIVAPTLVSSRYVQLTPRYSSGPEMLAGSTIPLSRTASPVEWETVKTQLDDVVTALGPTGTDQEGALSRVLKNTSHVLDGNGETIHGAITNLAAALSTFDRGGTDLFSTVHNLQIFIAALRQSDREVAEFLERLDTISDAFADDKKLLRPALKELSGAVGDVDEFVKQNRATLNTTMTELTRVSSVVAEREADLAQTLHTGVGALKNLNHAYKGRQNSVGVNFVGANFHAPGQLICAAFAGVANPGTPEEAETLCSELLGNLLDQAANGPQSQELFNALLLLLSGGAP